MDQQTATQLLVLLDDAGGQRSLVAGPVYPTKEEADEAYAEMLEGLKQYDMHTDIYPAFLPYPAQPQPIEGTVQFFQPPMSRERVEGPSQADMEKAEKPQASNPGDPPQSMAARILKQRGLGVE